MKGSKAGNQIKIALYFDWTMDGTCVTYFPLNPAAQMFYDTEHFERYYLLQYRRLEPNFQFYCPK